MIYQETADLAADLPSFVEMCARLPDIKADASFGGCLGLASWGWPHLRVDLVERGGHFSPSSRVSWINEGQPATPSNPSLPNPAPHLDEDPRPFLPGPEFQLFTRRLLPFALVGLGHERQNLSRLPSSVCMPDQMTLTAFPRLSPSP